MARIKVYNYTFTPGAAGVGTVKLPGYVKLDEILMITNTTNQTIIYNFADTTKGGTIAFSATDVTFGQEGATTLTLEFATTGQLSSDKLSIYLEQLENLNKPAETFQDPVQKMRVSTPQSLIDTDFEYGIQPTKWEFLGLNNNTPSYFIRTSDSPITIVSAGAGLLFIPTSITSAGTAVITVNTANTTGLVANVSKVYIYNTTAPAANGLFIITAVTAGVSFTYNATTTVGAATISQATTRVGTTTINGTNVFLQTSADISPTNFNVQIGTPINIQETTNESLADGSFLVSNVDQQAKLISYVAKGTLTATPLFSGAFTAAYIGKFFGENVAGASIPLVPTTVAGSTGGITVTVTGTSVNVTTVGPHGLYVGSQLFVSGCNNELANGSFTVVTVPSATTFTYTALGSITAPALLSQGATAAYPLGTQVFARPDANLTHRAQDGGVQISTTQNVPGQQAIRQTRRYFRYQSGKGIQFSTAAQFKPAFDVTSITASATTATVTTETDHGLAIGAIINVTGITVASGTDTYTGNFAVASVPSTKSFTYTMAGTPTDLAPRVTEKVTTVSWYGARARSGLFDEQNGFFFEFDGQRLFAVRRNSTTQMKGTISVCTGLTRVVGTSTQFNKDLRIGDYVVIKGQSYQVTRITSATDMDIAPAYRAPTPSVSSGLTGIQLSIASGIATNGTTTTTVNTRVAHNLIVGQRIYVYNTTDARVNGSFTVASVPTTTQFTYTTTLASAATATVSNVVTFTGTTSAGSNIITSVSSTSGLALGQVLTSSSIPAGTTITLIGGGGIATTSTSLTITNGGSGYQRNKNYNNVPLRNITATGTSARATIQTNNAGVISFISVTSSGNGYTIGGTLTVNASDIGGTGAGAIFTIATLTGSQLVISASATATTTGSIGVEVARVFAEETNVRFTKTIDLRAPSTAWSIDRVDGTGPSGYIMNLNKIQMIYIDYQWYGAGYIRFGMRAKTGEIYYCHKFLHNNILTEAYMRSGNVPARFEVNTIGPNTFLTVAALSTDLTFTVADTTDFPTAGQLRVENELINYTGKTLTTFTGLTRGVAGGGAAAAHSGTIAAATGQATVQLVTQQLSPALSHWGVSVIMDGRFDDDVSYVFVTPKQTASTIAPSVLTPLMSIRVAPSVDSGIPRPFGVRNLLNRMQLKLAGVGIFTNSALLVQIRLNCTSPIFKSENWLTDTVGNGSLAQVIYHNSNDQIFGGDQVFAFFVDAGSPTQFSVTSQSLTNVKDLGTSILSGDGVFPDGPEVLTIFVTNLGNSVSTSVSAAPVSGQYTIVVTDVTGIKPGMFVSATASSAAIGAQVVSITPSTTTATVALSKPNTGTTTGVITFDETATVYGRLSWTEAQA